MMRFRNSWLLRVIFWAVVFPAAFPHSLTYGAHTQRYKTEERSMRVKVKFISEIPPLLKRAHTQLYRFL